VISFLNGPGATLTRIRSATARPAFLFDLGQRRLAGGDLTETVAAEQLLEHLLCCGWRVERTPPAGTPAAR
jgi:hypothetical protein